MDTNQILLETKLVGDIKGTFCVPSYQRGYRWGDTEVLRLASDDKTHRFLYKYLSELNTDGFD